MGKTEKNRKENRATKVTKRRKYGMNETLLQEKPLKINISSNLTKETRENKLQINFLAICSLLTKS